ncbi:MAG: hypothetical protein ABI954_09375 [Pyrinomonadaceae bacterium]
MAILKKRNEEIANSLLLESSVAIELPPAEVDSSRVTLHFETFEPFVPEILEELKNGTVAETVPVIKDGSTFAIHGRTKTFWVKIWHKSDSEMTVIERLQILNCLPSMRNVKIFIPDSED